MPKISPALILLSLLSIGWISHVSIFSPTTWNGYTETLSPDTVNAHKVSAQQIRYEDYIYEDNIKTVRFYPGFPNVSENQKAAYPILFLNERTPLTLEFDELIDPNEPESYFLADLINCDANWRPTTILPIEFYEGFSQKQITQWRRSEFTNVPYIHYTFTFPFENEFIKKSGNYILKVYRNNNQDELVLTRRFVVVDPLFGVEITNLLNTRFRRERLRTLNFNVFTKNLDRIDPTIDITVFLLQNFRWDNAIKFDRPQFFDNNSFEYFIDLNAGFPGGNEFRYHEITSTRLFSQSVDGIELIDGVYSARLFVDEPRSRNEFTPIMDRNGTFSIDVQEQNFPTFQADYLWNLFLLKAPLVNRGEVYVFGSFSDWNTLPEYQMEYNSQLSRYEADFLLKQGIYDYQYVIRRPDGVVDDAFFEGRHTETENFYNILVYFRKPGDRTDQLLGFLPINYF